MREAKIELETFLALLNLGKLSSDLFYNYSLNLELEKKTKARGDKCLLSLLGVDPDDTYNETPYEKGFCFVSYLAHLVGDQDQFDNFLKVRSTQR